MKRSIKHINPRYLYNKLLVVFYYYFYPTHPWLTKDAIKILSSILKKDDVGVEFGSGRSTIWFAKQIKHLISIEHDVSWYKNVKNLLKKESLSKKVDFHLKEKESDYQNFCESINNETINFCLIDGIARDHCALKILPKIKPGGLLIIDNINWFFPNELTKSPSSRRIKDGYASETWSKVWEEIKNWRMIWTSNGVCDTAIWIKSSK